MEAAQSNFDAMVSDLKVEGYTLKEPGARSAFKEYWNGSPNKNGNLSHLLNIEEQKPE